MYQSLCSHANYSPFGPVRFETGNSRRERGGMTGGENPLRYFSVAAVEAGVRCARPRRRRRRRFFCV